MECPQSVLKGAARRTPRVLLCVLLARPSLCGTELAGSVSAPRGQALPGTGARLGTSEPVESSTEDRRSRAVFEKPPVVCTVPRAERGADPHAPRAQSRPCAIRSADGDSRTGSAMLPRLPIATATCPVCYCLHCSYSLREVYALLRAVWTA